jgi:hypothetical protein
MVCPTCGKVCGKVTGDQPSGKMRIEKIHRYVTGFEGCKSISIMYQFENGKQGVFDLKCTSLSFGHR